MSQEAVDDDGSCGGPDCAVRGLANGLLGLVVAVPAIRRRQASWTSTGFDVLLIALGLLVLYRVATSDSISLLLGGIGWLVVGSGLVMILVGIVRRPGPAAEPATGEPQQ